MAKKENVYPFIAAMASLFLSSVIVLEIAGGVEDLFNKLPLIVLIGALLIVIIISLCVFIETKAQMLLQEKRKISKEYESSLQTLSDLINENLTLLKNLADLSNKLSRRKKPKVPVFKISLN